LKGRCAGELFVSIYEVGGVINSSYFGDCRNVSYAEYGKPRTGLDMRHNSYYVYGIFGWVLDNNNEVPRSVVLIEGEI
jgi:hypothetical protein